MAEFVYGNDALLDGKSDAGPLTVPANQGVTATEWNTDQRHKDEIRTAIKAGEYHGLSQSSEAVSASNKAKLRLNTLNRLQASVSGGAYQTITNVGLHVADYGAVGDGTTDDATSIQAAIDAAASLKRPVIFDAKIYKVNTELKVLAQSVLIGTGYISGSITMLKAGAAIRSVLRVGADSGAEGGTNTECTIKGIHFEANHLATYAMFCFGLNNSLIEDCRFQGATKDGVHLEWRKSDGSTVCISDNNMFVNCQMSQNGSIQGTAYFMDPNEVVEDARYAWYVQNATRTTRTVTMTATNGSVDVVGSAGTTFITWGFRVGDPIRIGQTPNSETYVITEITSETALKIHKVFPYATASGLDWAYSTGAGYWENGHTDNNINRFYGGLFRSNCAYHMHFRGIYGPAVDSVFMDYCPNWGIKVGDDSPYPYAGGVVTCSLFTHIYFERMKVKPFFFFAAADVKVLAGLDDQYSSAGSKPYDVKNAQGVYQTRYDLYPIENDNGIGSQSQSYVPAKYMVDGRIFGKQRHFSTQYNEGTNWTPTGGGAAAIDPAHEIVPLSSTGAITVVAVPHFTVTNERIIYVYNRGTFNIVLQDESSLAGSKLQLAGTANVTLTPRSSITLMCQDGYWTEISRSIR